jgi:hypothetical protein
MNNTSGGGTRFDGHNTTCMKQLHERKTILKEVKNLSKALINRHDKLQAAMVRIKEER